MAASDDPECLGEFRGKHLIDRKRRHQHRSQR